MPPLVPTRGKTASLIQHLSFVSVSRLLLICGAMLVSTIGCRSDEKTAIKTPGNQPSNTIVTTSYPLEWVTQEIVGDEYTVNCPAGASDQPDRWRPDRNTIAKIQAADLIICNGVAAPYANWMKTVSLPTSKVVQSASQGLSLADFISVEDIQTVHSHGPEGEHSHPTMVSRTWLAPTMLIKQANYITQQLCKQRPSKADKFKDNLTKLTAKLESATPQPLSEQTVSVFSATPELKFLTRASGVNDLHFNWHENTTLAKAEVDFAKAEVDFAKAEVDFAKAEADFSQLESNLADKDSPTAPKFILLPQRLKALAARLMPLLQQQELEPVFIDMLDKAIANRDFVKRLDDNFAKMKKITSDSKRPPSN